MTLTPASMCTPLKTLNESLSHRRRYMKHNFPINYTIRVRQREVFKLSNISRMKLQGEGLDEVVLQRLWFQVNQGVLKKVESKLASLGNAGKIIRVMPDRHPSRPYTAELERRFKDAEGVFVHSHPAESEEAEAGRRNKYAISEQRIKNKEAKNSTDNVLIIKKREFASEQRRTMASGDGIKIPSRLPLLLTHEGVLLPGSTVRLSVDSPRNMHLVGERLLRGTSLKSTIIGCVESAEGAAVRPGRGMLDMSLPVVAKSRRLLDSLPRETLPDVVASMIRTSNKEKLQVLDAVSLEERFKTALSMLTRQIDGLNLLRKTRKKSPDNEKGVLSVRKGGVFPGRQFNLDEEDEEDGDDAAALQRKVHGANMPEAALRVYCLDIRSARTLLDNDHYAMDKLKRRVLEYLAVRQLKASLKGPILCFVGPPGVGKTSVGRSIARTLGREFHRIALGGVCDQSDIRGHRRTYVGSMPGRIINGLKTAGVNNPVFLLDEVDKLGKSLQGDPAAALLEVLDPEQNHSFTDHYLNVAFDLSQVLFIATANTTATIPPALLDRMELLQGTVPPWKPFCLDSRNISGRRTFQKREEGRLKSRWSLELMAQSGCLLQEIRGKKEKMASRHIFLTLWRSSNRSRRVIVTGGRSGGRAGSQVLENSDVDVKSFGFRGNFTKNTRLEGFIAKMSLLRSTPCVYTREAGVRSLERKIGAICRAVAVKVAEGRRVTETEASMPEKPSERGVVGGPDPLDGTDIHLHFPAGAVTKDGPSAGVTIVTCLASLFSGRLVRSDIAMTGEITLRGLVLPVGGIKDKVLAAYRAGVKRIILPKRNDKDLEELPANIRAKLDFVTATNLDEVLNAAFDGGFPRTTGEQALTQLSSKL
ncbi:hypothetical protein F2P81_007402 [Scophthalmus maximus]|uniref:Lon proteolytic domain-containing protein n=1 Tax=Scophthalmus maximus TaxID=52904 RepID=A0A6A4TE69_SCOMX|nr:hypothetical protein F2P81_007402 [Scophthalmus maximus]